MERPGRVLGDRRVVGSWAERSQGVVFVSGLGVWVGCGSVVVSRSEGIMAGSAHCGVVGVSGGGSCQR